MRRTVFIISLLLICLTTLDFAFGQSEAKREVSKSCHFNIVGMWKSDATDHLGHLFFLFSPNGWVRLMEQTEGDLPEAFEVVAEIQYKVGKPAAPKFIEFTASRGNDVFQQGVTLMDIVEYGDDSLTTADPSTGEKTRWERIQTHRYFITFAARSGTAQQGGPAFVMLTTLDGRRPKLEAIGLQLVKDDKGKASAEFGLIPSELSEEFQWESDKDSDVMMRLELSATEYEKTYKVFEAWKKRLKDKTLPHNDPYLNAAEFLKQAAESLNECSEKVKLPGSDQLKPDQIAGKQNPPQRLLDFVKEMRKKNDKLHIVNAIFPTGWRPLQLPGGQ